MKFRSAILGFLRRLISDEILLTQPPVHSFSIPQNGEIFTHTPDGQRLLLDPRETFMTLHYLEHGDWEPHVRRALSENISEGAVVIDVGANTGVHTLLMGKLVGPKGKVIAIEPSGDTFQWLRKNIDINGLNENVEVVNVAIGSQSGEVEFSYFVEHPGMSGVKIARAVSEKHKATLIKSKIKMNTLDQIAKTVVFPEQKVGLVKIDVEGFELEVIKGATALISHPTPPVFIMEYEKQMADDVIGKGAGNMIESIFRAAGFSIFRIERLAEFEIFENQFQHEIRGDYLFVKKLRTVS